MLTASHNPGGIRNDFGIKYNIENGGPAPDQLSNAIYDLTTKITQFKFTPDLDCDFSAIGTQTFEVKCCILSYIMHQQNLIVYILKYFTAFF